MVLARSNRVIDLKNAVGNYEFTLTPRAPFAPDGSILPCTDKSKLIHYLEKLGENNETHENAQTPAYEEHVDKAEKSSAPSESPKYCHCGWNGARPTDGKKMQDNQHR